MDIFKRWWFYVIAAAIVMSLPFAIRTAASEGAESGGVDTAPGQEQAAEPDEGGPGIEALLRSETEPSDGDGVSEASGDPGSGGAPEEIGAREESDAAKGDGASDQDDGQNASTDPGAAPATYVLNTNTKKFHCPDCPSVGDIKDKNRRDTDASRQELIDQGYEPCKRCCP